MFKHHPHNFCGFLLTQTFGKLLETFVFLSVNLTISAIFFFHKNGKKKPKKKKTISLERNSGNSSHISVDQISN
jgi:hypothetical protein